MPDCVTSCSTAKLYSLNEAKIVIEGCQRRAMLTHEYGHVRLHGYLFEIDPQVTDLFNPKGAGARGQVCKRNGIIDTPEYDWMEWQAGYVCGSLLMPVT